MFRTEVNVQTGEQKRIELTAAEIADLESRAAAESAIVTPEPTVVEKLSRLGLTVDDLKELLNL